MLLGGVMMTAIGFATGEASEWRWSTQGLVSMAYLTILSSCIAYTAFAWLARNTTPAMTGTYSYVNPAIAAVLGWWFLGETLSVTQIAGMAIMFAGVALVSWPVGGAEARAAARGTAADP
jgi:drug/metabolite transporter (DMT)-like permease